MDEELQLSPDPDDLLIDLGAGNEDLGLDVNDKELDLDLLDEEDVPDSPPVEDVEIKNRVSLSNQLNKTSASALKDVIKDKKQTRKKVITPIKFDEVDATNGALENDGKLNRYSNSVEETCKNLGLKDCFFSYTDDNFAQIQEYDQFRKLVRGRLYGINPGAPTSKMLALLSAKWRQFQNIRAKKYKKGGLLFSQKLKVSDPILKQKDLLNQSNEVKLKNKKLSKMSSGCIDENGEITPVGSPTTSTKNPNFYNALHVRGTFFKKTPSATSSASMSPSDTRMKPVSNSSFKVSQRSVPNIMESPRGIKIGASASPPVQSPSSSVTGGGNTFRFGSSINPLEQLRLQNLGFGSAPPSASLSAPESGIKMIEKMTSSDLEALLMRKRVEEVLKKQQQEEEAARLKMQEEEAAHQAMVQYDLMRSNVFASNSAVNASNLVAGQNIGKPDAHAQTMASQLRITNARMQQIQKQLNLQNKKMSNFENEKKQMEIDHLKALLAIKQGSDVGSLNSMNKGSVRARVGPKNQLNGDKSQQDVIPIIRKHAVISDNFNEDDFVERDLNKNHKKSRKKHRSTTSSLPADLILTNLTEEGPKPAAKRIRWSDDENGDSYDFKRQRKQSFNDVDSEEED